METLLPARRNRGEPAISNLQQKRPIAILAAFVAIAVLVFVVANVQPPSGSAEAAFTSPVGDAASGTGSITINFTATVDEVFDVHELFKGAINVDDPVIGAYTFDPTTPDTDPNSGGGLYVQTAPPGGIWIEIGDLIFETDPSAFDHTIQVVDGDSQDAYYLTSHGHLPPSPNFVVDEITMELRDDSSTALIDDSLPKTVSLADWEDRRQLFLINRVTLNTPGTSNVRAQLTSLEVATGSPDLIIESIADAQQPFINCKTPTGLLVTVRNAGDGLARPSTTHVSSGPTIQSIATPSIPAGQSVVLFSTVQGIPSGDSYTAVADFTGIVDESDETNNTLKESLSLATLPTCTPTPTPTPTFTPTPTPTNTRTPTNTPTPKAPEGDTDGDGIPNSIDPDDDNDGCTDEQENGDDETLGGLRDPHNPWDFYDVLGPNRSATKDGYIDVFNDIVGVMNNYEPAGYAPGAPALFGPGLMENYDRGARPPGSSGGWSRSAPDGTIDLFTDIVGVINSAFHDCR